MLKATIDILWMNFNNIPGFQLTNRRLEKIHLTFAGYFAHQHFPVDFLPKTGGFNESFPQLKPSNSCSTHGPRNIFELNLALAVSLELILIGFGRWNLKLLKSTLTAQACSNKIARNCQELNNKPLSCALFMIMFS